ncbi:GNAT family N-acetyltransferase [Sutterella sp.]|uniref:GNAT family N-acetyltransferase n=1 Tax=Sutterella sp. TaxID=1981025 RepID=UPI0026E0F700|nr:GNAT family N-acetyltransferase [Sutterella sp.]MDO5532418.1 GNAT family N-acetyltransferase [Sutterella sp.]
MMRTELIRDPLHPLYDTAMSLYRASFPFHEQREGASQAAILRDPAYQFRLVFEETPQGEALAGIALLWETGGFVYVEHLAVQPLMRGRGTGARILGALAAGQKPVILEIDPPVDEISRRRKAFYERCGFTANAFAHVHPPYHRGLEGHALVVMSAPGALTEAQYADFGAFLRMRVMAGAFA